MKKYNYVYKITNLNPIDQKKYYIGLRSSESLPIEDEYWGSSKLLKKYISEQGIENFHKEILFVFNTRKEAFLKEIELHEKYKVSDSEEYYNIKNANIKGFDTTGGLYIKDENNIVTFVTSQEYKKNSNLNYHSKGKITVKDNNGNTERVDICDKRYLNGELVSVSCDMVNAINKEGDREYVTKKEYYNRSDLITNNNGKFVVKYVNRTEDNRPFLINKNDVRVKSGEVVSVHKGTVTCVDLITGDIKKIKHSEFLMNEKLVGINKNKINGSDNPNAKIIIIYDSDDNIKFECFGDFEEICLFNKLPYTSLKKSYLRNTIIYNSVRGKTEAKKRGNMEYVGWYARLCP